MNKNFFTNVNTTHKASARNGYNTINNMNQYMNIYVSIIAICLKILYVPKIKDEII